MTITRVLIVDDHPLLRRGVRQLLDLEEDFETAAEASNGADALTLARDCRPDLILLDVNMAGGNGVDTLRALRESDSRCRVVMLTVSDQDEDVATALRFGADGYLLKDMEPEFLLASLRRAARGEVVISEQLTPILARILGRENPHAAASAADLTGREREILRLIARGLSNKMIARRLDITEGTIKVHVKNLLRKLGLRSRVEAAVWAVNQKVD